MTWTDVSSPRLVLQHTGNHSYESTSTSTANIVVNNKDSKKRKADSSEGVSTSPKNGHNSDDKRLRQSYTDTTRSQRVVIHHSSNNSSSNANAIGNSRRRQKVPENSNTPRWHSQSYLLFLALRQHPTKSLPRTDLIKAALALDEKISKERNIPRVFRGKTPTNSASAILTNNIDRYFVPFRPNGSRCMHFKLAFDPGNLKDAIKEYTQWETRLAQEEWPLHFGKQKRKESPPIATSTMTTITTIADTTTTSPSLATINHHNNNNNNSPVMTEFDAFLLSKRQIKKQQQQQQIAPPPHARSLFDDFDMTDVPRSWRDLIRVVMDNDSQPQQQKLIAKKFIPNNTPLGFYFGVPMTTDEFESLKESVGNAKEYSVTYKGKTVLDPTNDHGSLYEKEVIFCPFHYIRQSNSSQEANVQLLDGPVLNQIICWTRCAIAEGEELVLLRV
ncbi:hypothetical protein BDA99DRAFT_557039 [Phascolomyces articulosus]|uniref:Uncharacterized protein n=1 Tax=Phascolomyces articulosus TaxID=60185 RepID=A0AAD5PH72_9FUNG|nr:hypothetical protein BDA99DRAFT_557039 [Phascolomyces articulosus]